MKSLLRAWTGFVAEWRRERLLCQREIFFDRIFDRLTAPPDNASVKFGQDVQLRSAKVLESLIDVESGTLYVTIETLFEGMTGQHSYSLYLTGDLFRIGLLLYGGLESAPLVDWQNELQELWPGCPPEQHDRGTLTMYEWTFLLPDLYENYATQERYTLGLRHMHCRMLRIIQNYRLVQTSEAHGAA